MEALRKRHQHVRLALLVSLVLFLIGLFALVSRWDSAIPLIVVACAFRLVAVWLVRGRYNAAWMEQSCLRAARRELEEVAYTAREPAPAGQLMALGFAPQASLAPDGQRFHVLRGRLAGRPAMVAETAFVPGRGGNGGPARTVAGTLISVESVLPAEEAWVALWAQPLDGLVPLSAYHSQWEALPTPAPWKGQDAPCFTPGGAAQYLDGAARVLAPYCRDLGVALAARDGTLSLFLADTFYARKPDISQPPTEAQLEGMVIPGLEVMRKLCDAEEPR